METQRGRTKIEDVANEIEDSQFESSLAFLQLEVLLDIRELLQNMENGTTVRSKWGSKL